jgi:hypothetical protein
MQAARETASPQSPPVDYSFITAPQTSTTSGQVVFANDPIVTPGQQQTNIDNLQQSSPDVVEQALLDKIHHDKLAEKQMRNPHHKTIKTAAELAEEAAEQRKAEIGKAQAVTPPPNPVNIELAKDAGDLNIATIAGLAKSKIKATATEGEIRIQH